MVQFVEMEGKMNRNGCIEVPVAVLEQAGIGTGEAVKLFYMADRESLKNESREFMIFRADEGETAGKQEISFQIPQELLKDAGIPLGADLDIVCRTRRSSLCQSRYQGKWKFQRNCLHCVVNWVFQRTRSGLSCAQQRKGRREAA